VYSLWEEAPMMADTWPTLAILAYAAVLLGVAVAAYILGYLRGSKQ